MRSRSRASDLLFEALASGALVVFIMELLLPLWRQVGSSTESWMLAQVHRALLSGDYRAAAAAASTPSTTYDLLFPGLVTLLSRAVALLRGCTDSILSCAPSPLDLAHLLAAGSLGVALWALFRLGREMGGSLLGLALLSAGLFPPMLATGAIARADSLGQACALMAVLAAALVSRREGSAADEPLKPPISSLPMAALVSLLSGFLAGLAWSAREYLFFPALTGVLASLLLGPSGDPGRRRSHLPVALLSVAFGIVLGGLGPPLLVGVHPLDAFYALRSYSHGAAGRNPWGGLAPALYLRPLFIPVLFGLAGWLVLILRLGLRRTAPLWGLLLGFVPFLFSRQQSPQYYLLAHVLLLGGAASLPLLLPRPWLRAPGLALLAAVWAWWSLPQVPGLLGQARAERAPHPFHSEAWPAPSAALEDLLLPILVEWESYPIALSSQRFENLDAFVFIRTGRPVAALSSHELGFTRALQGLYGRSPLILIQVEEAGASLPGLPGAVILDQGTTSELTWRNLLLQPLSSTGPNPCPLGPSFRGACLQAAWLQGGEPLLIETIRRIGEHVPGLLSTRSMMR